MTDVDRTGRGAVRRPARATASRTRACSPGTAPTSTTSSLPGHAARVLRAQRRRPRPRSARIDTSAALAAARRPRRVHRRRPEPGRAGAVAHVDRRRRVPRRRARRSPTATCASSATRSRSSSPRAATLAEDAAELVEVDIEPLPAVVDYTDGRARRRARPREPRLERRSASSTASRASGARRRLRVGRPRRHARRSSSRRTRRADGRRAASSSTATRASGDLTIYAATQTPHEVRLFCSRLLGMPEHRIRVVMRDVGGGFGQKVMVQRDEMCLMLAAREARRAGEVDRGPPREPARGGQVAPRARRRARWRSTPTARSSAATSTSSRTAARIPTPWPVGPAAAVGMLFPGPYRMPARRLRDHVRLHQHRRAPRVPRPVAVRDARPRADARHRRPASSASTRSSCAGATCCTPTTCRTRTPTGMPYDRITPLGDARAGARDARLRRVPRRAGRGARTAGRFLGVGVSAYVEPSTPGYGVYATRSGDRSASSRRAWSTCTSPAARTGKSLETTVAQVVADALGVDIDDVTTIQGDTAVTGSARAPAGAGARSMTAGAVRETRADPARAHRRDRRPPAGGRARGPRARRRPRDRARHAARSASRSPRSPRSPTSNPRRCRPASRPGSRRARATPPTRPSSGRTPRHVCTCEVDVDDRRRHAAALHRERGLRRDDQPDVVEGQIAGGVVQGIGGVLFEHLVYDEDGNPLTTTFVDYLLPTAAEVPDDRVRPHRDAAPPTRAGTRAWARAAPSARRRRSSTRSPTRSRRSA